MITYGERIEALEVRVEGLEKDVEGLARRATGLENDHDDMRVKVLLELAALRSSQDLARTEIRTALRVIGVGWGVLLALVGLWLAFKGLR